MKRPLAATLVCLLGSCLTAACVGAGAWGPPAPAVLAENTTQCRAQLNDAARELLGQAVALTSDAFAQNDAIVLSTVGQSASGRMTPPTTILRLQRSSQGCLLRLDGREPTVALPRCSCRALTGRH